MPFVLYRREAFEPLTETPWDEAPVREAIRRIVADVDAAHDADALWPADEWDGWQAATPMKNLYVGAAGVIHALDVLRRRGVAETASTSPSAAARRSSAFREEPGLHARRGRSRACGIGAPERRDGDPRRRMATVAEPASSSSTSSSACGRTSTTRPTR